MTPQEFAKELGNLYGNELKSVVLYGSAAGGEHSKKFSDYNVFCVLENPSPANLARATRLVKKWVKKGNSLPLFFGPEHIETSLDVFPMEFMDIFENHKVLFGSEPLKGMKVDLKNLRHQCESELKGKLLHLRSFYAGSSDSPKEVARMMVKSFSTFLILFKGVLRLSDTDVPRSGKAVVEKMAGIVDVNPGVFFEVIEIRTGESVMPRGDEALSMFERYLTGIEDVTRYVDRFSDKR